ncbi:MAG: Dyp-type peroxidase, partial [Rubrivivax sp.]
LLPGLDKLGDIALRDELGREPTTTESEALSWLQGDVKLSRPIWPNTPWSLAQVQSGIVQRQQGVRDAALLLLSLDSPQAGAALLQWLVVEGRLARGDPAHPAPAAGDAYWTVSFTATGLARLGLDDGQLEQLPAEFVQGMAARASVLGDVLHNHPSRWLLPLACAPDGTAAQVPGRVELAGVHAVVQVALRGGSETPWREATDPAHPLHGPIKQLLRDLPLRAGGEGVRLLSVQTMRRVPSPQPAGGATAGGHFGFADGLSQPIVTPDRPEPSAARAGADEVPTGDLLLGHPNSLGDEPLSGRLWHNGSFLVVRRLRQDVAAYEQALDDAVRQLQAQELQRSREEVAALLMGRRHDGRNLIDDTTGNGFDYQADAEGVKCPWQSHVRRANPRATRHGDAVADLVTLPRLMRRGMSYGPSANEAPGSRERGLVFMAYNASIAEQFEVIQGWLAGGNSSSPSLPSRLADPFLAARHPGEPARFRFRTAATAGSAAPFVEHEVSLGTQPFTVLEWGLYLFAPSVEGLDELRRIALAAQVARHPAAAKPMREERRLALERERLGLAAAGARVVQGLQRAEQALGLDAQTALREWKLLLEDPGARRQGLPQAVWAAVRAAPGGVMRTPYGVLVGSAERVAEVFEDPLRRYTVAGYQARMEKSFGSIFLGMDAGADYGREAGGVNRAIMAVTRAEAHGKARQEMASVLEARRPPNTAHRGEVVLDLRDLVDALLAALSRLWFGLPDGTLVHEGGWHWRDGPPRCPGHFHTPSRYLFQPHPGAEAAAVGQAHGQQLRQQVGKLVAQHWRQPAQLGRLGADIHAAVHALKPVEADAQDLVARTLVGVMMGFLPTVDGNLRGLLFDWLDDGTFWDLRRRLADARPADSPADDGAGALARVRAVLDAPLARGLQCRPVPDIVWRTVVQAHTLGEVSLQPGD